MGKIKLRDRSRKSGASKGKSKVTPEQLLLQATSALHISRPDDALVAAKQALSLLQPTSEPTKAVLPALDLLGEIYIELGDPKSAREHFELAVALDKDGKDTGAEKFLWLAQLNEEGGQKSVDWFKKGVDTLKREITELETQRTKSAEDIEALEEKNFKLSGALCGIAEVYMTDLSWEADAEAQCEAAITEALLITPDSPEPLQTLASIRISQERLDDAKAALSRSMILWKDLDPSDPSVPDYSTRISLSRLLMESNMEEEAIEVLERLVGENDESVEAWYLGGWCLYLLSRKQEPDTKVATSLLRASHDWLSNCLKLYTILEYEDERLKSHAEELLQELNNVIGNTMEEDEDEEEGEEEWEDEEDETMDDS